MSTYLIALKRAYRAVDALGGRCSDPTIQAETDRALDHACQAIELLITQQTIRELDAGMWSAD
jgi:hypothetical protein